jgi:uncharacterized protein (TIGR00297 family)
MELSQHDIFSGSIATGIIVMAWVCAALAIKIKLFTKFLGRKFLHVAAICTCAWAINRFENRILLAYIFLTFFIILLAMIRRGWMQVNDETTYGIALFPLAFAFLLFMPVLPISIIVYAVLILGISDAAAGIAGEYLGKRKTVFLFEEKSWAGFIAFYSSAFLISLLYFNDFSSPGILLCMMLALLPAVTELFSYRGSDNFTVPIFSVAWALLIRDITSGQLDAILFAVLLFAGLSIFAKYQKWLTASGAMAAFWIALLLYASGGYKVFIAPGIFLIMGSLLSKLNKDQKEKEGRNALQVFANGITGVIFIFIYGLLKQHVYLMDAFGITNYHDYLIMANISFCISMADSASSELGVYFKGAVYDILSFKRMPVGVSGGISWQGTIAGLAGAMLISFAVSYVYHYPFIAFCWISLIGFIGMLMDSILGSLLQAKYKTTGGVLTDEALHGAKKVRGFSWCTNDMVNIISNTIVVLLFFYVLFK